MVDMFGAFSATIFIAFTIFLLLIWHSSKKHKYWKNKGIPYVKPTPLIGNILDQVFKPIHYIEAERYIKYGPLYGYFEGNRPLLSVGDTKLIRDIFVKDFQCFPNRRKFGSGNEIMDSALTSLDGEDWKRVRSLITPTFSSGKLKRMISIFKDCARALVQNFKISAEKGEHINVKELYGALSLDVIASSAFSTKLDSHNDPQNKFVQAAKEAFGSSINYKLILFFFFPRLSKLFRSVLFNSGAVNFFINLTFQIIEERKRTGQKRNDFLQLLLDTAEETSKQEKSEDADKEADIISSYDLEVEDQKVYNSTVKKNLSMNELVAQCVIFFLAGYETTASTLSFASYALATNQDVQEKLHQEIKECLKATNGELTYEALQKMKYLDNVISETLRMYTPIGRHERKAECDYKLSDTGITIPKDMIISIPVYALHTDPTIFLNPDKFDPNRFTAEERGKRDPFAYLPFGAGPRNCIGMRFALLEIKMTLVYVISHFTIKPCSQTQVPLQLKVSGFGLLQPKDIVLEMEPRGEVSLIR